MIPSSAQARCQAPGDSLLAQRHTLSKHVSISSEMPGPWRRIRVPLLCTYHQCFNLKRDARPLATGYHEGVALWVLSCFNLKARCQAPGDSERSSLKG